MSHKKKKKVIHAESSKSLESVTGIKLNKQDPPYSHPMVTGQNADIKEGMEYVIKNVIDGKINYDC